MDFRYGTKIRWPVLIFMWGIATCTMLAALGGIAYLLVKLCEYP